MELVDLKFAARFFAFKFCRMHTDLSIRGCRRFTHLFSRFVRFFSQGIMGLNVYHLVSSGNFSLGQTTVKVRTLGSLATKMLCHVQIARLGSLNHFCRNSVESKVKVTLNVLHDLFLTLSFLNYIACVFVGFVSSRLDSSLETILVGSKKSTWGILLQLKMMILGRFKVLLSSQHVVWLACIDFPNILMGTYFTIEFKIAASSNFLLINCHQNWLDIVWRWGSPVIWWILWSWTTLFLFGWSLLMRLMSLCDSAIKLKIANNCLIRLGVDLDFLGRWRAIQLLRCLNSDSTIRLFYLIILWQSCKSNFHWKSIRFSTLSQIKTSSLILFKRGPFVDFMVSF